MPPKPVTTHSSQTRVLKSKHTKRRYRISISIPYGYFKSSDGSWPFETSLDKWPVVYLLDGNWFFGMVADIVRNMAWFGNVTDAIVVGIGYPDHEDPKETLLDTIAQRFYDLSPVRDENTETWMTGFLSRPVRTGHASAFLNFIRDELIPVIEQNFRTDPKKRILAGHSLGGTFTAFVLLENPELFDTFIVGSPFLSYGSGFAFRHEEQFAKRHKNLVANVHLWVGDLEETQNDTALSDAIRFGAILEGRKYKGLKLFKQIFPNLNHSEVIASGFQAGLKWALKK